MADRIVITGLGAVSPYGVGVQKLWDGLRQGISAIRRVEGFRTDDLCCQVGAEIANFPAREYLESRLLMGMDIYEVLGVVAAEEALKDAGLSLEETYRLAVIGGTCLGGLETAEQELQRIIQRQGDLRRVGIFTVPKMLTNMLAGWCAIYFRIQGPNIGINTACSTGNYAIALASLLLRSREADAVLVVCAEKAVTRISIAGFCRIRALARMDPEDPTRSLKVFDRRRSGTLFGDGAGALILERERDARARDAKIYAEVAGFGMSDDAYHIAAPDPKGEAMKFAMRRALQHAGLAPEQVDYINAHGTGTPYNDVTETRAIKEIFGERAYNIPISSIKSMIGHQLAAASATEAIASVLTIRDGIIPPTVNLEEPDPECDLDYVPNRPRRQPVHTVLSNSFAFGGHNCCVVFRRYEP